MVQNHKTKNDVVKVGIVCAMQEELNSIIGQLGLACNSITEHGFTVYFTKHLRFELVFILCGIGKVNAAIHTQYVINKFMPNYVINVGVAGSLSKELSFGDVVIASDLVQHDMDVRSFNIPLGQIPRMDVFAFSSHDELLDIAKTIKSNSYKVVVGRIATGDQFIDNKEKALFINQQFNALACEMEGAAVAHTCYINKVPFIVVRALSDMAGRDDIAIHSFDQLKEMAADRSSSIVKQFLDAL